MLCNSLGPVSHKKNGDNNSWSYVLFPQVKVFGDHKDKDDTDSEICTIESGETIS